MAERLKDIFFTNSSINKFGDIIKQYYPEFDKEKFLNLIFNDEWKLKDFLVCAFQENQGSKAFSRYLAHFVKNPPCYGRNLPPASSGAYCFLPGAFPLF